MSAQSPAAVSATMTVEEARTVALITPDEVDQAEREAADAEALVAALEERVRSGDDTLTPAEIETQRDVANFAKLRAEAITRKLQRSREAQRLRILGDLADAMRTRTTEDAATYGRLFASIEDAVTELITFTRGRDEQLDQWRLAMHNQGVPMGPGGYGVVQPERHGRVGWGENGDRPVFVDGEIFEHIEPGLIVVAALQRATRHTGQELRPGPSGSPLKLPHVGDGWIADPADQIAKAT